MKQVQARGILLLAFTLFFSQLYGQSTNGSIGGTIEDVTQALLPGVTVTATNVDTGVASTSLTNETGAYNFPNLLPGQYKVTAELPSFQTETKINVEIGNGQQLRLNFVMKVAGGQQSVEVTVAADSLIATSSASVAGVLNEQRVRELPIVGNNAMDLFSTQPGIVSGFSGTAGQARSEASYETSISGLNVMGSVNVTRDGINNSAAANSNLAGFQAATVLNPDMVGELRVIHFACGCGDGTRERSDAGPHPFGNQYLSRQRGMDCPELRVEFKNMAREHHRNSAQRSAGLV